MNRSEPMMPAGDRSIGMVVQDIVRNLQDLIRAEMRLAKAEVREDLQKARSAGTLLGIAAVCAIFGVLFLLFGVMYALALVLPQWAAALAVGAGIGIIAGVTLGMGIKRLKRIRGTPRTIASLKENVEWAKQSTS